jgi:quercetin dioxygenase-like cupin family protein
LFYRPGIRKSGLARSIAAATTCFGQSEKPSRTASTMGASIMARDDDAHPEPQILRKHLLTAVTGAREIGKVEIRQIDLAPGQKTGLHRHPCPVVGYVAEGVILFQTEGEEPRTLSAGNAFFEPADARILHFDNASPQEPVRFIAFYLLGNDDEKLIEMLD